MAGVYGNDNLAFAPRTQFVTVDNTSDLSAELNQTTQAVTLYSTTDTWVNFTEKGKDTPAAAAPGAEKTVGTSFFLPASTLMDVPVPQSTDEDRIKVAYVRNTADGTMYIIERNDTN